MFRKKAEQLIGLDLGSHAIKMVQLEGKKGTPRLLNMGLANLPEGAFDEGGIREPELIADKIRKLVKNLKIKERLVAISISGYEVMIKKIELPTMTEEELDSRVSEELGQYIPYNIDEVNVGYQILGGGEQVADRMEVLLVAAKKEAVEDYVNLVSSAGLDPMVVDVDFFALGNAFEVTHGIPESDTVVLLDIGASKANMDIYHRGNPIFTKDLPTVGGMQITRKIAEDFDLSVDQAERVKLGEIPDSISKDRLGSVFISTSTGWVGEVRRAIDFYYANYSDNRINRMYLCGGSSKIPGLDKLFERDIGVKVEIFNPLNHLEYDDKVLSAEYVDYVGPQMAIGLGLALRKNK